MDEIRDREVLSILRDFDDAVELLLGFFGGDVEKTKLWLKTKNPQLGNVTPFHMYRIGKADKVLKFIKSALEDNELLNKQKLEEAQKELLDMFCGWVVQNDEGK